MTLMRVSLRYAQQVERFGAFGVLFLRWLSSRLIFDRYLLFLLLLLVWQHPFLCATRILCRHAD